jgi:hypothetical protein
LTGAAARDIDRVAARVGVSSVSGTIYSILAALVKIRDPAAIHGIGSDTGETHGAQVFSLYVLLYHQKVANQPATCSNRACWASTPQNDNFVIQVASPCRARGARAKIENIKELPVAGRSLVRVRLASSRVQKRGGGWCLSRPGWQP